MWIYTVSGTKAVVRDGVPSPIGMSSEQVVACFRQHHTDARGWGTSRRFSVGPGAHSDVSLQTGEVDFHHQP